MIQLFNSINSAFCGALGINSYLQGVIIMTCINVIAVLGMSILTGFTRLFSFGNAGFMSIGAYTAAMNGITALVFTAGIGENDYTARTRICKGLEYLGIKIDEEKNRKNFGEEEIISAADSRVKVVVVPTDEELLIASDTLALVQQ